MMPSSNKVGIIGIGNPLRGDDGIGHWVIEKVEEWKLPGVFTIAYHQLQTELIEQWLQFDAIVIIDAALNCNQVLLEKISADNYTGSGSSHHMNPELLASLAKKLFQQDLAITICKIEVENFELGAPLSATAIKNGELALQLIRSWVEEQ